MENLNVSSAIIETATETPSFKRTLDNVFYKFTHKINKNILLFWIFKKNIWMKNQIMTSRKIVNVINDS